MGSSVVRGTTRYVGVAATVAATFFASKARGLKSAYNMAAKDDTGHVANREYAK